MASSARARHKGRSALPLLLLVLVARVMAEDIVVIVNPENTMSVDRQLVQQLYLGNARTWPDGSPSLVLDQAENSPLHLEFCTGLLGRTPANVRALWAQMLFTGRGLPPKVVPAGDIKRLVAANLRAIAYIRASELDGTVRGAFRFTSP